MQNIVDYLADLTVPNSSTFDPFSYLQHQLVMVDEVKSTTMPYLAFTTVTNIRRHVQVVLDLKASNFKLWKRYFLLVITRLRLTGYLDGTITPASPIDLDWIELDALVQSWIFGSVSPSIAELLIDQDTAAKMWSAIESLFHDNKKSRAMELDSKLHYTSKGDMSITDYCQVMKNIFDSLKDVDDQITEDSLVLQILKGLPREYNHVKTLLPMQTPFPSFMQTRSLLILEELRILEVDDPSKSSHALYSSTGTSTRSSSPIPSPQNRNNGGNSNQCGKGKGKSKGKGKQNPPGGQSQQQPPASTRGGQQPPPQHQPIRPGWYYYGPAAPPHGSPSVSASPTAAWPPHSRPSAPPYRAHLSQFMPWLISSMV
uniref:GAG n=1 Tax=Mirabilis jalapa TaxID=3538 RepID=A0A288R1A8_MIRJA|nr:GAG [Mirabilis jalapa]